MHLADVIILALVAVGAVRGYQTGFFKQAGSLVGFVLAFAFGTGLMRRVGAMIADGIGIDGGVAPILGFVVVFAVVYVLVVLLARFAEDAFGALKISFVNRAGGGVMGGLKAALFISVALIALSYLGLPGQRTRDDSALYTSTARLAPVAWSYVSDNTDVFEDLTRRLEDGFESVLPDSAVSDD